jgi:hypothetical protein
MTDPSDGFKQRVLTWVQQRDPSAATVTRVFSQGCNYAGCTGDLGTFEVTVRYYREDGEDRTINATGDTMASLWDWVMAAPVFDDPSCHHD